MRSATERRSASQSPTTARSAFTLVEMLVVIVIIGILAALAMAAMFASQEAARQSRTEGFINVLNTQMAYRWESYRTRRLPVSANFTAAVNALGPQPNIQQIAALQLIARRQLMRIELPDRWWDVAFDDDTWTPAPVPSLAAGGSSLNDEAMYDGKLGPAYSNGVLVERTLTNWPATVNRKSVDMINRTSLSEAYKRRYQKVVAAGAAPSRGFQGAECLYMILTTGMGDESTGGGTFNQQDFADTDQDGMPEFIDGWGRPIGFLRWAPGFISEQQTGDPVNDHDPFDPRRVDTVAFRLFPLIYSGGPDGNIGDDSVRSAFGIEGHAQDLAAPPTSINFNDPYAPAPASSGTFKFRGERLEEESGIGPNDNIFNQSLLVR